MKKVMVFILSLFICGQAFAQDQAAKEKEQEEAKGPTITFEEPSYDFGDISQGDKVNHTFKFSNTGTEPLILSNVLTTCGCTATSWPREPIAPKKTGEITVSFNSSGKMGKQNKIVTIVSNATNSQERVKILANVLPKKND